MTEPSTSTSTSVAPEATPGPTGSGAKTVFLIRHAHSMENQRIASMFNCFGDLGRFSLPKKSDVGASLELLKLEHDAPLSEEGHKQCATMKNLLQEHNFVPNNKIELVVHSPLERAKQTCVELIGCSSDTPTSTGATTTTESTTQQSDYPTPVKRVVSLSLLEEKHQLEWVPGNTGGFEKRVVQFQQWLAQQPESVVCVVGHSQYFKKMLELPFKFDNTDVYQVSFDPQKTTPNEPIILEHDGTADSVTLKPHWYDLKLLHTCRTPDKEAAAAASSVKDTSLL